MSEKVVNFEPYLQKYQADECAYHARMDLVWQCFKILREPIEAMRQRGADSKQIVRVLDAVIEELQREVEPNGAGS